MEKYVKLEKLGEGTYGVVNKAKNKNTGELVALKKIRVVAEDEGIPSTAIREISLLKELNHPNIIALKDVIHGDGKKIVLVFEFCEYDLKKIMDEHKAKKGEGGLPDEDIRSYMKQMLLGVQKCHKHRVLHRDLKPQNLLVNEKKELKLGDFGLARAFGVPVKNYASEVVTLWYRPPDVLLGSRNYFTSVDIWSTGCIFAEMSLGKPLFKGQNEDDQLEKIFKVLGTPAKEHAQTLYEIEEFTKKEFVAYPPKELKEFVPKMDSDALDLLSKLLQLEPSKRIKIDEALKHPYFNKV